MVKVAKEIALQLTNAGLSVKVTDLPSDSLIIKLFTRDYDLYVLSWQVSEDFNPFPFWSSKKEIGRFNFVDYYNANVDSIVNLAMTTMDKDEAFGYWEEFQKIIAEDQPYAFLYVPNRIIIVNNTIKSFDNVYTSSIEPISNLDIFYVEKTAQKKIDMAMLINPVEKVEEKKEETAKKTENKTEVKNTETKKEEVKTTPAPTAAQLLSQQVSSQQADTVKKEEEKKTAIIVQPAPVKIIQPSYPEAAKKIGAEGTVYVEAIVGKDGKVVSAKVIKSLNSVCDEAAVNAAMQAVFKPGTSDGVPTEMKTTIPYRFKP
jgi:TonB family protein